MHALIIEPDPLFARKIEKILKGCGYKSFTHVSNTCDAEQAALQRCPDLITSEVIAHDECDVKIIERICTGIPARVIFITNRHAEARRRWPDCAVIRKPFADGELADALRASSHSTNE